jgi:hypothetical protein
MIRVAARPFHHRHADVHQDDVRALLGGPRDRLLTVDGLADDVDVRLGVSGEWRSRTGPFPGRRPPLSATGRGVVPGPLTTRSRSSSVR